MGDHRIGFAAAMAALQAEFSAYLDWDRPAPAGDLVGTGSARCGSAVESSKELIAAMGAAVVPAPGNGPRAERPLARGPPGPVR